TQDGQTVATPIVEVKNLNSFRALRGAIEHEFERQQREWIETGRVMAPGAKSTRGWDDVRMVTVLQREKEEAHDYRYFPDPDLIPVVVTDEWRDRVRATIPELPHRRMIRYIRAYGLSIKDAQQLIDDPAVCDFYEACVAAIASKDHGAPGLPEDRAGKQ